MADLEDNFTKRVDGMSVEEGATECTEDVDGYSPETLRVTSSHMKPMGRRKAKDELKIDEWTRKKLKIACNVLEAQSIVNNTMSAL